ncbi:MAG TPA: redox-sensing transcriptional repressor Rex [Syntrophothermus lipocalidus]|uniref:Redox-sensing transcriptional repressor Rex n=1 Tax=Syntrophothermus lipocalidus (strain DSM 12680 / TGB-C1) TaxID=643648 RepID=D7CL82_SYNLT|nr:MULTISPECIES: redox-sensing transcriptional repressor Rex [Syntrophothermus]ADI01467.1 CoA-binding domain protein [Syntrophothermus lipocalidus DSM 12680]NSW82157.1 redox-sensing transcriptional repressor Rex [Syntrophothermus sp.]HHV76493.1 redox-sensing transcriptional repressor Rex [Syntrophothermus lipocalidus]HOV43259.1 redox-sensing transcriptional repressor Rex [Syntrophothermus lipocalidus]
MKAYKIPEATVQRLSIYSRHLAQLISEGVITVSSGEIARGVGVSSAQVRKDLAYFGEFGTRGVGYNVQELYSHVMRILGLNHTWNVMIVGAGKLGSALAVYKGFEDRGFKVRSVLDVSEQRIGQQLGDLVVESLAFLEDRVSRENIDIGIITVPAAAAQEVTDKLIRAGVKAILNFSPRVLKVPDSVVLRNVDLSVNLEVLSFNLSFGYNLK